ncbi:MAG: glycosyltransferase family 4 protein [Candidatus Eisenbacteria bacterium]
MKPILVGGGAMAEGMGPLRILHATPFVPFPPDSGGKLVPYHHAVGLTRRGHELTLVAPIRRTGDLDGVRELSREIACAPVPCRPVSRGMTAWRFLGAGESIRIARHRYPAVEREVKRLLARGGFDLVLLDSLFTAYLIPLLRRAAPRTPLVLVDHNVESSLFERYLAGKPFPVRAAGRLELARIRRAEGKGAGEADRVLVLSGRDREELGGLAPGARIHVLPPGAPVRPGEAIPPPERPGIVLFLGSYRWAPNREAARWLADAVFPIVRRAVPSAELRIAGDDPNGTVGDLHRPESGIHVLGRVDDAAETVRAAAIFVVPLRVGGGVRLKILEAMANERPVVSTALGVEGIPCRNGEHLLVADDAESIAGGIVSLIRDEGAAASIARAGRSLVEREFGWNRIVERLEAILLETARGRQERLTS